MLTSPLQPFLLNIEHLRFNKLILAVISAETIPVTLISTHVLEAGLCTHVNLFLLHNLRETSKQAKIKMDIVLKSTYLNHLLFPNFDHLLDVRSMSSKAGNITGSVVKSPPALTLLKLNEIITDKNKMNLNIFF